MIQERWKRRGQLQEMIQERWKRQKQVQEMIQESCTKDRNNCRKGFRRTANTEITAGNESGELQNDRDNCRK